MNIDRFFKHRTQSSFLSFSLARQLGTEPPRTLLHC